MSLWRDEWLDTMESGIQAYGTQFHTGNSVLDTILTAKGMYCDKHGITFTCVTDGKLLDTLSLVDLCTIFGNALDNAIDYSASITDPAKRLIHVTVSKKKGFLFIRVENYFEGELRFEGELQATTKDDPYFHGYGLKSIKYAVSKYSGTMTVGAENNWFGLNLLIPIVPGASPNKTLTS